MGARGAALLLSSAIGLACAPATLPDPDRGLAAERRTGWAATSADERREVRAFARAYLPTLSACTTPRRTVQTFVGLAAQKGFAALPERIEPRPGARWMTRVHGKDFAFVVWGRRPIEHGLRLVVVTMESPRIDLRPRASYAREGFLMFDTRLVGEIDLPKWLSHPLALYGHVVRDRGEPTEVAIGAAPADPVFVIPDLLPHLAGRAQAERIIDAERFDAIAGTTTTGEGTDVERLSRTLHQALESRYRLGPDAFAHGEFSLVPAVRPTFLGVDEGLVGGYGQSNAANAFAALHALVGGIPERTAVLVALEGSGPSGQAPVVPLVVGRILAAAAGEAVEEQRVGNVLARSGALCASPFGGVVGEGLVVDTRRDDALPALVRQSLDAFESAGAQVQLVRHGGWPRSPSRRLGELDLDSMDVSIPIADRATPVEIVSPLDLWSAYRAFWGFYGIRAD